MSDDAWSWGDVEWGDTSSVPRPRGQHAAIKRGHGRLARFVANDAHGNQEAARLRSDHPALTEGRTLFRKSVFDPENVPRLLISGVNSMKIGKVVEKGAWRGLPIYTLTLEERASCPTTCGLLSECFGNAMPFARRIRHTDQLIYRLELEVAALSALHPAGFAVRLHVLGDFWSVDYVLAWTVMVALVPGLHVFGFTAHQRTSPVGRAIAGARDLLGDRWSIRFSVAPTSAPEPGQATTIWRQEKAGPVQEGFVCPAQSHRTETCGTCGLCWAPPMWNERIVFIGHGLRKGKRT